MSGAPKKDLGRYAVEILIALAVASLVFTPPFASAATGLLVLLLFGPLLLILRPRGPGLGREGIITLAAVAGLGVFALLFSLLAVNPLMSFVGKQGQHVGSAMWLAAAAALASVLLTARPGDVGRISRAVAIAGAVFAATALLDAAGVVESFRFSPEPAGVMESSISLGQVLVVAAGCGAGWALAARSSAQRLTAVGVLIVIAAGLAVADARSAIVAVVVAAVLIVPGVLLSRWKSALAPYVSWGIVGVLFGAMIVALVLFAPGLDSRAQEFAEITNDRSVIWSSAFASAAEVPVLGKGPEQFSAWVNWDSEPGVSLSKTGTYDPHNIWVYWLVAGGAIGVAAAFAASGLVFGRLWKIASSKKYARSVLALIGGVVAWGVSVMFGWVSPVALLLVALVVGALVGAQDLASETRSPASKATNLLAGVFVLVVAVTALGFWWTPMLAEYEWASAAAEGSLDPVPLADTAQRSEDPGAAAAAVAELTGMAAQNPEQATELFEIADQLEPILERNAVWHVDAALEGFYYRLARIALLDEGKWSDAVAYIEAGKKADPASGLWDYIATVSALQLGEDEAAQEHAEAALEYPLPEAVRTWCEQIVDGAAS